MRTLVVSFLLGATLAADVVVLKNGFNDCPQCKEPRTPPALEEICTFADCPDCEGRGTAFRAVRWTCRSCRGVGLKIVPKSDPSKTL